MTHSTITSKGQVTIPAEIREALALKKGDRLVWKATPTGLTVMVERVKHPDEVYGLLRHIAKPGVTHEQERAAIAEAFSRGEGL